MSKLAYAGIGEDYSVPIFYNSPLPLKVATWPYQACLLFLTNYIIIYFKLHNQQQSRNSMWSYDLGAYKQYLGLCKIMLRSKVFQATGRFKCFKTLILGKYRWDKSPKSHQNESCCDHQLSPRIVQAKNLDTVLNCIQVFKHNFFIDTTFQVLHHHLTILYAGVSDQRLYAGERGCSKRPDSVKSITRQ